MTWSQYFEKVSVLTSSCQKMGEFLSQWSVFGNQYYSQFWLLLKPWTGKTPWYNWLEYLTLIASAFFRIYWKGPFYLKQHENTGYCSPYTLDHSSCGSFTPIARWPCPNLSCGLLISTNALVMELTTLTNDHVMWWLSGPPVKCITNHSTFWLIFICNAIK